MQRYLFPPQTSRYRAPDPVIEAAQTAPPLPTQEQVDALIDWEDIAPTSIAQPGIYGNEGFYVRTCSECGKTAMLTNFFTYPDHVSFVSYKCYACGFTHAEQHGSREWGPRLDDSKIDDGTFALEVSAHIDTMRMWLAPYLVAENPVVREMIEREEKAPRRLNWDGSYETDSTLAGTPIEPFI